MNPTRDRLLTSDSRDGPMADGLSSLGKKGRTSSGIFQFPAKDCAKVITAKEVQQLRDFSSELPNLGEARRSYLRWRKGESKGVDNRLQKLVARVDSKNGTPSGTPRLGAAPDPQVPSPTNLVLNNFMPTTR